MQEQSFQKVLVIAAHPDDEVLGAGGTIARFTRAGIQVKIVIVATGISSRYDKITAEGDKLDREITELQQHSRNAARCLGVDDVQFLGLPDNRLDTISRMDIVNLLHKVKDGFSPDLVLTHHSGDYNWDHGRVHDAVLMAFRASPGEPHPASIWTFEVLSSTERSFAQGRQTFSPNQYVSIQDTLEAKINSLKEYPTELHTYPHPRSPEAVKALAQLRGTEVGLFSAEAFSVVRSIMRELP